MIRTKQLDMYLIAAISTLCAAVIGSIGSLSSIVVPLLVVEPNQGNNIHIAEHRVSVPLDVDSLFHPVGWMGDSELGTKYITLTDPYSGDSCPTQTDGHCIKFQVKPGPSGWAGIYWLPEENNWGDKPGIRIVEGAKLTFWAKGETGEEVAEFIAGGIYGRSYSDSFRASTGRVSLTSRWKEYAIDLTDKDLSNVVGAFACVVTRLENPAGATLYLDSIRYE